MQDRRQCLYRSHGVDTHERKHVHVIGSNVAVTTPAVGQGHAWLESNNGK